jgi:hypothetical protein
MKASALAKVREVTLDFGEDGDLNLVIDPGALTPAMQMKMAAAGEEDVETFCELLPKVIRKWDLLDEEGQIIPLTPAGIADVPYVALGAIFEKMTVAVQEEVKEEGKDLAATSPQTDS